MIVSKKSRKNRVLVIDDELGPRESIRFLLKNEYDVDCADSVDHGLDLLRQTSPDVIILDIKMPGKNGIEGLEEIRVVDPHISVIMLTGFGTLETAQEAMRLGARDYIKKPFDAWEMRERVGKHVGLTQVVRKRARTTLELKTLNSRMQVELAEKEHLASLGQASSEFVHDLRNPLTVVYGYVQILMQQLESVGDRLGDSSKEVLDYMGRIEKNVKRCQEMSEIWKNLGKHNKKRMKPCVVSDMIEELAESCAPLAAETGAQIDLARGPSDCVILADRIQIFRAIQNIVSNAIQALPEKDGIVRLSWSRNADHAEIRIEDNGCGLRSGEMDKVFTPYYTTKEDSDGMGLGLFISMKVVETHDGCIRLTNNANKGASATIQLPLLKS